MDASTNAGTIRSTEGAMIAWDLSNFSNQNTVGLPDGWFKAVYPWANNIIMMTSTGGRSTNDMYHEIAGTPYYNFNPLLESVGNVLRAGKDAQGNFTIKPVIALAQIPYELALNPSAPSFNPFGVNNVSQPKDYTKYYNYIQALAQALVNKFGLTEVESWSWKLYTEPDNNLGWWAPYGTNTTSNRDEYFKLYDYTNAALQSVIPSNKLVVGPGNMLNETTWGSQIIAHAATGTNAYTGTTGTQMNTFTFSWYARHGAGYYDLTNSGSENLQTRINSFQSSLAQYPQLNVALTGSDETAMYDDENGNAYRAGDGGEVGASWYAGLYKRAQDNHLARVTPWFFWTTGSLTNPAGNKSAMYNAYLLTNMLGASGTANRLSVNTSGTVSNPGDEVQSVAAYDPTANTIRVLVYNHNPSRSTNVNEPVTVALNNVAASNGSNYVLRQWRVDSTHSNFYPTWLNEKASMGIPTNSGVATNDFDLYQSIPLWGWDFYLSRIPYYNTLSNLQKMQTDQTVALAGSSLSAAVTLPGHSVALLEFVGVNPSNAPATSPKAPTGLAAATTSSQVDLSWNAVSGASSYTVKRSLTAGGPYSAMGSGIAGTSYTINDTSGTQYYYVVSAVSGTTESAVSNEVGPVSVVLFQDTTFLNTAANWSVDQGTWSVSNGLYQETVADSNMNRTTIKNISNFQDFSASVDIRIDSQPFGSNNWAGFLLRKTNMNDSVTDSGYLVAIQPNGTVGINRGTTNLATVSTLANPTTGFVRMKVVARGPVFDLYANGRKVATVQDSTFTLWGVTEYEKRNSPLQSVTHRYLPLQNPIESKDVRV
ncbi:GH39 family glycosyl hydrolase [Cohnella nanjingensis]|uniref:GH39 family glycosyl hydrolase n=1 Tax=Cohnella nanjingensis TaxID=1387779 RepID=UPI001C88733D|nr:family 16 glycoside hydrolase [Cohnella nanjingensis]